MTESGQILVLWDIDRTLLYVGDIDRQVYRETFAEIVGRTAERLPARGTGVTMPLAIRSLLLDNGVPETEIPCLLPLMVELLPQRLAAHAMDLREQGVLLPGAWPLSRQCTRNHATFRPLSRVTSSPTRY